MSKYLLDNNQLVIIDEVLEINITSDFHLPTFDNLYSVKLIQGQHETYLIKGQKRFGLCEQYYSNGTLRAKMFYKNDLLHGPVKYFSSTGSLLVDSWYFEGEKVGRVSKYYTNGKSYSEEYYKYDTPFLTHHFYYEDGKKKSVLPYSNGKLDGIVLLYSPNGQLKRKVSFKRGLREGMDDIFSVDGKLLDSCEYKEGKCIKSHKHRTKEDFLKEQFNG